MFHLFMDETYFDLLLFLTQLVYANTKLHGKLTQKCGNFWKTRNTILSHVSCLLAKMYLQAVKVWAVIFNVTLTEVRF